MQKKNDVQQHSLRNNLSCSEMCNCNDDKSTCDKAYPSNFTDDESDEAIYNLDVRWLLSLV